MDVRELKSGAELQEQEDVGEQPTEELQEVKELESHKQQQDLVEGELEVVNNVSLHLVDK